MQFHRHSQRFDLLILDLNMPGNAKDGFDILKTARQRMRHLRILVISGFLDGALLEAAQLLGAVATLAKPIDRGTLVRKVREILGDTKEATGDATLEVGNRKTSTHGTGAFKRSKAS